MPVQVNSCPARAGTVPCHHTQLACFGECPNNVLPSGGHLLTPLPVSRHCLNECCVGDGALAQIVQKLWALLLGELSKAPGRGARCPALGVPAGYKHQSCYVLHINPSWRDSSNVEILGPPHPEGLGWS